MSRQTDATTPSSSCQLPHPQSTPKTTPPICPVTPNAAVPEKGKFNFEKLSAQAQGLGASSSAVALAPGALELVAVVSVALVVGADVSSCALLDLVRTENLSLSLSAKLNLFRDPSAAGAVEAGSVG